MPVTGTWAIAPTFESPASSHIVLGNILADPESPFDSLQRVKREDLTDFPTTEDEDPEGSYSLKSTETSALDLGVGTGILQLLTFVVSHHRPSSDLSNHEVVGVRTHKLASTFTWIELRTCLEREPVLGRLISGRPVYIVSGIMIAREFHQNNARDYERQTNLGAGSGETLVLPSMHGAAGTSASASVAAKRNNILFAYQLHKLTLVSEVQERQIRTQVHRPPAAFASVDDDRANNGDEEEETGSGPGQAVRVDEMTSEDWSHHDFQILPSVREESQGQTHTGN